MVSTFQPLLTPEQKLIFARLAYQSTGVIYGDIGTSPLYVYSSTFSSPPNTADILGSLSLIIWSLTLIVTVKYGATPKVVLLCKEDADHI